MAQEQTYAHHRRIDPLHHGVSFGLYLGAFAMAAWLLWRTPSAAALWMMMVSSGLLIHWFKTRAYALKVQDRIIRLEERLRMERLLPADLAARIGELGPRQFVALRFASDAELADRVREALVEGLGGEAIKQRIRAWRPDTFRV